MGVIRVKVHARHARLWIACVGLLGAMDSVACGAPPAKTVSVRVHGTPEDARVVVDDVFIGSLGVVSARGLGLLPGKHTLSIEAPGYFPHDRVFELEPGGERVSLDVALRKLPE